MFGSEPDVPYSMDGATATLTIPWSEDGMGGHDYDLEKVSEDELADLITNSVFEIAKRKNVDPLIVLRKITHGVVIGMLAMGLIASDELESE